MKRFNRLITPYLFWLLVFTVIPMLLIIIYAFMTQGTSVTLMSFTLENFQDFLDPVFISVLVKSFALGIITTIICLFIGYPAAYYISKLNENKQTLMILLITFPTWINLLMRTYALINILSNKGIISIMFALFGIEDVSLLYTDFAVILGMVYNFLPFMILPIHTSLTKMDPSLVEAGNDLGASPLQTFWKVVFPLTIGGVITGITMVFLPAISAFAIPKLLGGGQYLLIGNFIETQFITVGNWNFGSAVFLILAIIVLIFMAVIYKVETQQKLASGEEV